MARIGGLEEVVVVAADPRSLARFRAEVLGTRIVSQAPEPPYRRPAA
jgi:hypothetical protein